MKRREDDLLLQGHARFIADLDIAGMLEAVVVRSPEAHANLSGIDTDGARQMTGVIDVFTADDLPLSARNLTRQFYSLTDHFIKANDVSIIPTSEPVLADSRVRRVGEPVALVLAESRAVAEDARDAVFVDLDPMPPLVDPWASLEPDATQVDPKVPGNLQASFSVVVGDPSSVMAESPVRVGTRFRIGRSLGSPIENRGVMASYDESNDVLTIWATTQIPHVLRAYVAEALERPEESIRVVTPHIGGSFGGGIYPEEIAIAWAAMRVRRPVRWLEDRTEQLTNSRHSRDQYIDAELGLGTDGRFRALTMTIVQDCGFVNPFGITLPHNIASHARSQYSIPHFGAEGLCVLTNKTRNTPVRGAGRPEASFVIERLVDMAATSLDMDPAEIRRINLIQPGEMPKDLGMMYRDGNQLAYDTGDFPDQLEEALRVADYDEMKRRRERARSDGRLIGIGIGAHVEGTGLGPFESASVEIDVDGTIRVASGSQSHGQSHHTVLAQICADVFEMEPDEIVVESGDTALLPTGGGTYGSRSAVTAGSAVHRAAGAALAELKALAARALEIASEDLVVAEGFVSPKGVPHLKLSFGEVVASGESPGILTREAFTPSSVTFGSGTQVAEVEVDPRTGFVQVLSIVLVHDCGTALNPMVVEGQQHGAIAHGVGNALLEDASYNAEGQPTATNFIQYLLPTADDVPRMTVIERPHPTYLNPMGVKGAGEGATASTIAAIVNAIADALRPLDVHLAEIPVHPELLVQKIEEAQRGTKMTTTRGNHV